MLVENIARSKLSSHTIPPAVAIRGWENEKSVKYMTTEYCIDSLLFDENFCIVYIYIYYYFRAQHRALRHSWCYCDRSWFLIIKDHTGTVCDRLPRKAQITSNSILMELPKELGSDSLWQIPLKNPTVWGQSASQHSDWTFLARSLTNMGCCASHDLFSLKLCCSTCEAIICWRTLQRMQVREIGLQFAADNWSPFWKLR